MFHGGTGTQFPRDAGKNRGISSSWRDSLTINEEERPGSVTQREREREKREKECSRSPCRRTPVSPAGTVRGKPKAVILKCHWARGQCWSGCTGPPLFRAYSRGVAGATTRPPSSPASPLTSQHLSITVAHPPTNTLFQSLLKPREEETEHVYSLSVRFLVIRARAPGRSSRAQ